MALDLAGAFSGTARYQILRELGAGGMGVVFAAYDRERQAIVALKVLTRTDPARLGLFKREFRALADVSHPNLITYYELESHRDRWFFTMELVDGTTFLEHVRSKGADQSQGASLELSMAETIPNPRLGSSEASTAANEPAASRQPVLALRANVGLLRSSARQLASGVMALHKSGRLHCDLKPSNVMVTSGGRVVILDFGLVTDLERKPWDPAAGSLAGTPFYMAPEQVSGSELSEATDWYAVGVILYEALTGRVPILGAGPNVLVKKLTEDPPPPSTIASSIPEDLERLVMELLERRPEARPSGKEILERLGASDGPVSIPGPADTELTMFVGRDEELLKLRSAFAAVIEGRGSSVHVVGSSGVGKSALIRRFLSHAESERAIVLEGRCYERESVPYKALDSLVDGLTNYLSGLDDEQLHEYVPRSAGSLARLFPVMAAIAPIGDPSASLPADPLEVKRIAFAALRSIFSRISREQRLVLFIDDLHWGDEDSAQFLSELLRPPEPPPLLLLLAYRREEGESSRLVAALRRAGLEAREAMTTIDLDALSPEDSQSFAFEILRANASVASRGESEAALRGRANRIAHEARGMPFFLGVLARMAAVTEGAEDQTEISLDRAILRSVTRLSSSAAEILELVAIAGRPVSVQVLKNAMGAAAELLPSLALLRSAQLVKSVGVSGREQIIPYHDRIREVVVAHLPAKTARKRHSELARSIEELEQTDFEALVWHLSGAGESERAAHYAELAGNKAASALAFDQAAKFYRQALELRAGGSEERLGIQLAEALSSAGRGKEAADAFMAAAGHTDTARAIELRRRAGEELLISGHIDRGMQILTEVVHAVGMKVPSSLLRKLFNVIVLRSRIKLRGELRYFERAEAEIDPALLRKIDVCWTIMRGLGMIDLLAGDEFASRGWLLATESGEITRIARAIPHRLSVLGFSLVRDQAREQRFERVMEELHRKVNRPDVTGRGYMARGLISFFFGDFAIALEHFERAQQILHGGATGAAWETSTADCYHVATLFWLGRVSDAIREHHEVILNAERRGDWWGQLFLKTGLPSAIRLAEGDVDAARRMSKEVLDGWPGEFLNQPQQFGLVAKAQIALYEGEGEEALGFMERLWTQPGHRVRMRMQYIVVQLSYLRGRCALAAARKRGPESRGHLAIAAEMAEHLERLRATWPQSLALLIRAGIASAQGDTDHASNLLADAEQHALSTNLKLHATTARRRRGVLIGGDEGRALVTHADEWFARESIRHPERFAIFLAPLPGHER
jgi:eukaryotic-like serine/threonine-protein kinase